MDEKKLVRLQIELPAEDHAKIKKQAAEKYLSIKKWVLVAIDKQLKHEQQYE